MVTVACTELYSDFSVLFSSSLSSTTAEKAERHYNSVRKVQATQQDVETQAENLGDERSSAGVESLSEKLDDERSAGTESSSEKLDDELSAGVESLSHNSSHSSAVCAVHGANGSYNSVEPEVIVIEDDSSDEEETQSTRSIMTPEPRKSTSGSRKRVIDEALDSSDPRKDLNRENRKRKKRVKPQVKRRLDLGPGKGRKDDSSGDGGASLGQGQENEEDPCGAGKWVEIKLKSGKYCPSPALVLEKRRQTRTWDKNVFVQYANGDKKWEPEDIVRPLKEMGRTRQQTPLKRQN